MSFGRYELFINGEKRGDIETFAQVFEQINDAYESLEDQYSGEVYWELEDHQPHRIRIARHKMTAGLWYAYAENAISLRLWLEVFGWTSSTEDIPQPLP